jgi:outer membrane protein, heavy metal efflux system
MKTLTNKLEIRCLILDSRYWMVVSSIKYQVSSIVGLSIIAILLFTGASSAQVITLDSVLAAIDRQNPMLQQYNHKVSALNTYTEGATSWMAPMVGAGPYWYPYPGQKLMDERDKGMFMFNIEQDIPSPGKQRSRREYFNSRAGVEEQGRAIQYNALRSEAKSLYYDWMVLEKKLNVLNKNQRIVEMMLDLARVRYPYNQGSLGNIYKAEGRLYEVQNMILETNSEIEEKGFRLKALMNDHSDRVFLKIDSTTKVSFDPNKLLYDTASLVANRSDVQQINRSIQVMQQNQLLQKAQAKPDFRIRYEHMQPRGNMPMQFSLMAMVSIPIVPWASKMYKSESAGMNFEIEAMKKEQEGILLESKGMLIGMATQLKRMQQQLTNYQDKIIPALRKNYETVMLAYEENREQLPIVIDGWEAWNMAELEYLEKLQNYYSMIVRYEKEIEK